MSDSLDHDARLASLEARVQTLEGGRPGRKAMPIVVSEAGVCGVEPGRDSATCPHASLYRRQKGCKGTACAERSSSYYKQYRAHDGEDDGEEAS